MKGKGWKSQTKRHSNARKFGKAGGMYAKPKSRFSNKGNLIVEKSDYSLGGKDADYKLKGEEVSSPAGTIKEWEKYAKKNNHNLIVSRKPTQEKIKDFFRKAFNREPDERDYYFQEWVGRFYSPRRVWDKSDYERRKLLQKEFPEKFGKLDKDTNLNNPENQIEKYDRW